MGLNKGLELFVRLLFDPRCAQHLQGACVALWLIMPASGEAHGVWFVFAVCSVNPLYHISVVYTTFIIFAVFLV